MAACLALLGLFLLLEERAVSRRARRLPLRIAVTGTRGKSTVARLIAGSLRAAGWSVLAKTTGSKPMVILPDGSEEEIGRRGLPTVLEQKTVLERAGRLGVRALVSELMSVRPEVLAVESRRILRPHILVITNVRVDHRDEQGRTKSEVARSLASAVAPGSAVIVPEAEFYPEFEREARKAGASLISVSALRPPVDEPWPATRPAFSEDLALALAVAERLGIPRETAFAGVAATRPDFGSLRVWEADLGIPPAPWVLASAFAANDPESSGLALERLRGLPPAAGRELVGLLNLRADRGDRTVQWIEALEDGFFADFSSLYVVGAHVAARRWRRLPGRAPAVRPLPGRLVESIMGEIIRGRPRGAVLVGLGNMGGLGERFVLHWEKIGRPHAV
jgi:poly-gamma-glutamate synthase PgsB/CapB